MFKVCRSLGNTHVYKFISTARPNHTQCVCRICPPTVAQGMAALQQLRSDVMQHQSNHQRQIQLLHTWGRWVGLGLELAYSLVALVNQA